MQITKLLLPLLFLCGLGFMKAQVVAFPGAQGFGANASGGRGGKVIYVTNLNADGPGSLQAALNETGKRYILFKVSGVIPATMEVLPGHGDFTLAGQTSPKGIIVRGIQSYAENNPSSGNFIIRHLRSRVGDLVHYPTPYWVGGDGITLGGVHNAIIDHCSFAHASDEAVDISRSSSLTIQNCLLAETLGGHSDLGGMLINYSDTNNRLDSLSIHHNTWHRIGGRMPEISCESPYCGGKTIHLEISSNLFWDPQIEMWYEGVTGHNSNFYLHMNAVNNLSYARPQYGNGMFHIDMLYPQNNQLYFKGNRLNLYYPAYSDYDLFYCCNDFNQNHPNQNLGAAQLLNQRLPYPVIDDTPFDHIFERMITEVGAFPRDPMDQRLIGDIAEGNIDPSSINEDHYRDGFLIENNADAPQDADDDGMPDYWEIRKGLDPNAQDHNGSLLSVSITGVQGYTNLECYLNCLSDYAVNGVNTPGCDIGLSTATVEYAVDAVTLFPNPGYDMIHIHLPKHENAASLQLFDALGRRVKQWTIEGQQATLDVSNVPPGLYSILGTHENHSWIRQWVRAF